MKNISRWHNYCRQRQKIRLKFFIFSLRASLRETQERLRYSFLPLNYRFHTILVDISYLYIKYFTHVHQIFHNCTSNILGICAILSLEPFMCSFEPFEFMCIPSRPGVLDLASFVRILLNVNMFIPISSLSLIPWN